MRILILFCVGQWLLIVSAWAQSNCGCGRVAQEGRNFGNTYRVSDAQKIIDTMGMAFRHKPAIIASPYVCENNRPASSVLCFNRKYIFLDTLSFRDVKKASQHGDRFILAHEIAHHVIGHTTSDFYLPRVAQGMLASLRKSFGITISEDYFIELQADVLGFWLSMKYGVKETDLPQIFAAIRQLRYLNPNDSKTHPGFLLRECMLNYQLNKNPKQAKQADKQYPLIHRGFADSDSTHGDSSYVESLRTFQQDVFETYAFVLTNNRMDVDSLTALEKAQREKLIRRNRFSVDLVGGIQIGQPVLSRQYQTVPTRFSQGYVVGIRIGLGAWFQPRRVETDLLVGTSQFTTYGSLNGKEQPVEQFQTTYLYVRPRYVWSRMAHESKRGYQTGGWMITAGGAVGIPLHLAYKNVALSKPTIPRQQLSLVGVAGLGYGKSNWTNRVGQWRVWLMYQPQWLWFDTPPSERSRAMLHTLSLECSFRIR